MNAFDKLSVMLRQNHNYDLRLNADILEDFDVLNRGEALELCTKIKNLESALKASKNSLVKSQALLADSLAEPRDSNSELSEIHNHLFYENIR